MSSFGMKIIVNKAVTRLKGNPEIMHLSMFSSRVGAPGIPGRFDICDYLEHQIERHFDQIFKNIVNGDGLFFEHAILSFLHTTRSLSV